MYTSLVQPQYVRCPLIFSTNFVTLKYSLGAISLHSLPSWIHFKLTFSKTAVVVHLVLVVLLSLSFYSLFVLVGDYLSRLVSVSSNSMKSPVRIPHSTPWYNSFEGVICVILCKSTHKDEWRHLTNHRYWWYRLLLKPTISEYFQ